MKKIVNVFFVISIILFLMLGLISTLFFPEDINYLENRYANKVENLTMESYLNGSFQRQFSEALNDQVPLQGRMKQTYNLLTSTYEKTMLLRVLKNVDNRYVSFKGGLLFEDNIVYETRDYSVLQQSHMCKISNICEAANGHKDVEFYVYYIEKDTDIDFETNKKIGAYEYLQQNFAEKNIPFSGFRVNSFEDFQKYFYRTDHHWNCHGSYQGYLELIDFLKIEEPALEIKAEMSLENLFSGSKAAAIGVMDIFKEPFPVYIFDYPQMDIMIDGQKVEDYGNQTAYVQGDIDVVSYGGFYGGDNGEIIFDTKNQSKENILIIGESYDNAILKLLASHFWKTHSIDLRNYESTFGESFAFSQYVTDNNIDKVLLIGNIDYFTMEEFMLED